MKAALPLVLEGDLPGSAAGKVYAETALRLLEQGGPTGCVLVTSPGPGQGRSTTAANLSLALLEQKVPVMLLEVTDGQPVMEKTFGASPNRRGVEDVLRGRGTLDAVVCRRSDSGLYLAMMRRSVTLDLASPARRKCLEELLTYARQRCAWVVVDGPSGSDPASVQVLAETVTTVLLVVGKRATRRAALTAQLAQLQPYAPYVLMTIA